VQSWGVISMPDVDTIYKVPRVLHEQGLDALICDRLHINTPPANLKRWDDLVYETEHPKAKCTIAMVGKYVDLSDSYKSVNEALRHAGMRKPCAGARLSTSTPKPSRPTAWPNCAKFDGVLVPWRIWQARRRGQNSQPLDLPARTKCPTLGICLGMQVATIEYAPPCGGSERRQQHRVRTQQPLPRSLP
jgi:CTP synthase